MISYKRILKSALKRSPEDLITKNEEAFLQRTPFKVIVWLVCLRCHSNSDDSFGSQIGFGHVPTLFTVLPLSYDSVEMQFLCIQYATFIWMLTTITITCKDSYLLYVFKNSDVVSSVLLLQQKCVLILWRLKIFTNSDFSMINNGCWYLLLSKHLKDQIRYYLTSISKI